MLKNRLLTLYKALENQVVSDKTSGVEKARCAEIAASIALDVLKMESEGIKAVKELGLSSAAVVKNNAINNLRNDNDKDDDLSSSNNYQGQEDDNRKF